MNLESFNMIEATQPLHAEIARLQGDLRWLRENAPVAIWHGWQHGKEWWDVSAMDGDGQQADNCLGEGPTLHDAIECAKQWKGGAA